MKKTNKGFSLVELIIVIAIMAILAGAIAPALIRYIDKSRKSNDVTAAKSIKTAVETALGNENLYELCTAGKVSSEYTAILLVQPGVKAETSSSGDNSANCIKLILPADSAYSDTDITKNYKTLCSALQREVTTNIGEKMPKCKYKKNADKPKSSSAAKPAQFAATVSAKGSVTVFVVTDGNVPAKLDWTPGLGKDDLGKADIATAFELTPNVSSYYQ